MTTAAVVEARVRTRPAVPLRRFRLSWVFASEVVASVLGFVVLLHQSRRLGPASFARVEYAAAVVAWLLVVVRGGVDVVVYREAARRPRLIPAFTELLLGLRLAAAGLSFVVVLIVAGLVGQGRGPVVLAAGLSLFGSALMADVSPRAMSRFRPTAFLQTVRAIGLILAVLTLVHGPGDELAAAGCLVLAEFVTSAVALAIHAREHGPCLPRWRGTASRSLARAGAVAGLARFGRVTLYGLDMLAMGWWVGSELGPYSAARRLVFALAALGLVVPSALGPAMAQAWAQGRGPARDRVGRSMALLWSGSLPATLGLVLSADLCVPFLFGQDYRGGGVWLVLLAARLPWLLAASFAQAALVAFRHESRTLRLIAWQLGLALVAVPAGATVGGPRGVGLAMIVVELAGAVAGWRALGTLGISIREALPDRPTTAGCVVLCFVCTCLAGSSFPACVVAGAFGFGLGWACMRGLTGAARSRREVL